MNQSVLPRYRHIADGTFRVSPSESVLLPTGFLITVFLIRRLGPEAYGLFTLTVVVIGTVEASITSIFDHTTVKFVSQAEDWRPVGTTIVRLHRVASLGAMLLHLTGSLSDDPAPQTWTEPE